MRNLIPSNTNRKEEIITLIDNSYRVISEIYLFLAIKNAYDINYINKAKEAFDKMSRKDAALQRKIEQYRQVHNTRNQSPGSNNRVPIDVTKQAEEAVKNPQQVAQEVQMGSLSQETFARFRINDAKKLIDKTNIFIKIELFDGKYTLSYSGKTNSTIDKSILDAEKAITILEKNLVLNPFVTTYKKESAELINKSNFIIAKGYLLKATIILDVDKPSKEAKAKALRYLNISVTYLDKVTYGGDRVASFGDPILSEQFNRVKSYIENRRQGLYK